MTMIEQITQLYTYDDVATLLGVSDRTVWQLVKDGKLPAVRFGGNVRIDPRDVDVFIEERKSNGEVKCED